MRKTLLILAAILLPFAAGAQNLRCYTSAKYDGQYMAVPSFSEYGNQMLFAAAGTKTQTLPLASNGENLIVCPGTTTSVPFKACVSSSTGNRCGAGSPAGDVTNGSAYSPIPACRSLINISGSIPVSITVTAETSGTVSLEYWRNCQPNNPQVNQ